jgi:calcineurin-like phosphoesterase family protein
MPPHDRVPDFLERQLARLRDFLDGSDGVGEADAPTVARTRQAVDAALAHAPLPPPGDHYSRSPVVSLVQSALADRRAAREAPEDEDDDGGPVEGIAGSILARVVEGAHDFCDAPAAPAALGAEARLILISDWGTGRDDARRVAEQVPRYLDVAPEVPTHVIHLGDTYYSGTRREARRHVLGLWPVAVAEAGRVGSWALNGNHDMYSGGHGLFEVTLGDPRFVRQRADGRATSWFTLATDGWNIVGLDTAWRHELLEIRGDELFVEGDLGRLEGSQADVLGRCAADEDRRLLVLSHHQLFSAYDESHLRFGGDRDPTPLQEQLAPVLERRPVDAWFWGHEHDCLAYEDGFGRVGAARAVGHGAVPTEVRRNPATALGDPYPDFLVRPDVGDGGSAAMRALRWEYRDVRPVGRDDDDRPLVRRGFAVLDIAGDDLTVSYVDEAGATWLTESL